MKNLNLKCILGPEGSIYVHEERGKNDKYVKVLLFGLDTYSRVGVLQDYLSTKDDNLLLLESRYWSKLKCGAIVIGEYDQATEDVDGNWLLTQSEECLSLNIRNIYETQHCVCNHTGFSLFTDEQEEIDAYKLAENKVCKKHNQKCKCNLAQKSNKGMIHQKSTQFIHKIHDAAVMWIKQELYKSTSFYDCLVNMYDLKTGKMKVSVKITKE